jgi:hypothetical protein
MSGPTQDTGDIVLNKMDQNPCLEGAYIVKGKRVNKHQYINVLLVNATQVTKERKRDEVVTQF